MFKISVVMVGLRKQPKSINVSQTVDFILQYGENS